jgi:hypothetical protein
MSIATIVLVGLLGLVWLYMYKHKTYHDIAIPDAPKREGLLYGYYGCSGPQIEETIDHINVFMESQWSGPEAAIANILKAKKTAILDIQTQVFESIGQYYTVRADAADRLAIFFNQLDAAGALQYVKILYPSDEPNNTVHDATELAKAVKVIRDVIARFHQLEGTRLMVIYAAGKPFICQELYDIVGFDDYDKKSSVLTGRYAELKKSLLPHQQTVLVPGGCYGQDPKPFLNFANANPEVAILMPFIWFDDQGTSVGAPGIRSGPLKQAYIDTGKSII